MPIESATIPQQTVFMQDERPFALFQGRVISRRQLWRDVSALAERLPAKTHALNLCQNRYLFCVCLLAAASRGQICLLPSSAHQRILYDILKDYPDAYLVGEQMPEMAGVCRFEVGRPAAGGGGNIHAAEIDWARAGVVAFTSGSTGKPKPCPHSLLSLLTSARMALAALGLAASRRVMISTTPPQHMYGLETSVFWPLSSDLLLYDGRPFYPGDVQAALAAAPWPALLLTTPAHLRSLSKTRQAWTNLAGVLSATDTLPHALAAAAKAALGLEVWEIYGSTETLSFACRQALSARAWRLYPGCRLYRERNRGPVWLEARHLPEAAVLSDRLRLLDGERFAALGRDVDMVKVAGKRASLSDLNRILCEIAGVDDGVFYSVDDGSTEPRLAAFVVSSLSAAELRSALRARIDDVFLPRKIQRVATIPRSATGKFTRQALEQLLQNW